MTRQGPSVGHGWALSYVQVGKGGTVGTREQIVRAVLAGWEAGRRRESPSVCPYPATSILRTAWIRGYARARPNAAEQDTPWCHSCVDNCHDGSAEHVCVICDPQRYGGEGR